MTDRLCGGRPWSSEDASLHFEGMAHPRTADPSSKSRLVDSSQADCSGSTRYRTPQSVATIELQRADVGDDFLAMRQRGNGVGKLGFLAFP